MSEPYYADESVRLFHGDCFDVLRDLPDASVDAVVTDPPYGLEFMGKDWDRFAGAVTDRDFKGFVLSQQRTRNVKCPECGKWAYDHPGRLCECGGIRRAQGSALQQWCEQWATECLRILKPGGHLMSFGGSRTWHRLAAAIEDAGFELRDSIAWLYGSGFPKSLDVSKAIDKAKRRDYVAAAVRLGMEVPGRNLDDWTKEDHSPGDRWWEAFKAHLPADQWQAIEREVIAERSRLATGRVGYGFGEQFADTAPASEDAARWQGWGTALKPAFEPIVVARKPLAGTVAANVLEHGTGALNIDACRVAMTTEDADFIRKTARPNSAGQAHTGDVMNRPAAPTVNVHEAGRWPTNVVLDDTQAGASRFFPVFRYEAKAPTAERPRDGQVAHPTVKPLDLMRWLVRLVTPPGGTVLDPFAGSGTTAEACVIEGFQCITVEREADYLPLIVARLAKPIQLGLDLDGGAA
jgi:DNA modification methylase